MCGIVAYTGSKPASSILLGGLKALEYRCFDSAGMYLPNDGVFRSVGNTAKSLEKILPSTLTSTSGIAHARWATHGAPAENNTHPHTSQSKKIWLVHNGMIDNYKEIRDALECRGETFVSETDTEVVAHLIGNEYEHNHNLAEAVITAVSTLQGTFGLTIIAADDPKTIIAVSMGSPLVIGEGIGEHFVTSDTATLLPHTNNFVYLRDGEYAVVKPDKHTIFSFEHKHLRRAPQNMETRNTREKVFEHPHHMITEILEIPTILENGTRGRILMNEGNSKLGGLIPHEEELKKISRIVIVGCGSSYFSGLVGKLLIEDFVGIPVEVEYASEFRNRPIRQNPKETAFLALSQSGETAGTIASLRKAKEAGMHTIGIVNKVGSTIAKETEMGIYNHAGQELGVTSTKSFISQLEMLSLLALYLGRLHGLSQARGAEFAMEILRLPEKVRKILSRREKIKALAEKYLGYDDFLFIGRQYNIATAYEGALKLKKVSYVHAEGYPAGEMKHGPIAMVNEVFPTFALMPSDSMYEIMKNDIREIRERNGGVLAIATEGNTEIASLVDDVIYIPDTKECLTPILASIPLQLFAYYTGALRGFNIDHPLDRTRDSLQM
jgi:glutamine---fructose-6-phosphate transaminase (isomerizing)